MKRSSLVLFLAGLAVLLLAAWLWWMKPTRVDMAGYAPADSLLFIESDRPLAVFQAVTETEAWRGFERMTGASHSSSDGTLQKLIGWTGIGPIQSVILARAQVAVVIMDFGTTESGDSLKVKSEGAILIETHTSERRIRPVFEDSLKSFAEKLYANATLRKNETDGVEFIEWKSADGTRQIVGTVAGSLLIVGSNDAVVRNCLAVSQGQRPSLKDDTELKRLRKQLREDSALTFGYVPSGNSAKLLAFGIPVLLGRAPGDSDFQRLITNSATKVFGSLAWSSRTYLTGIEDRYLISLQPSVVSRLKPGFVTSISSFQLQNVAPESVYSLSSYRFNDPGAAWLSMKTAVSSQVDALSAIVFSSVLKAALVSYGIDEPETFLSATKGELFTLRLDEGAERSILFAGVENQSALREMIGRKMSARPRLAEDRVEIYEDQAGDHGAALSSDFLVMGSPADVRRYLELRQTSPTMSPEKLRKLTFFQSASTSANVVTFANDENRVRDFFGSIVASRVISMPALANFDQLTTSLPYSVTETTLDSGGLERTTRSPLGQFSTLLPLLLPEQPSADTRR